MSYWVAAEYKGGKKAGKKAKKDKDKKAKKDKKDKKEKKDKKDKKEKKDKKDKDKKKKKDKMVVNIDEMDDETGAATTNVRYIKLTRLPTAWQHMEYFLRKHLVVYWASES